MMERLRALRAGLEEQFEAMSTRDRNLATLLVVIVVVVIVGGITWSLKSAIDDKASRVRTAKENLIDAQDLAADYALLTARIEAAEDRMGEFRQQQFSTYVEEWATESGIEVKKVDPLGTQTLGEYKERDYRVDISRQPLPNLLSFLFRVETAPYPIRVRTAQFKVVEDRELGRILDADLEIATYGREEEG